jgi:hypothetical protein
MRKIMQFLIVVIAFSAIATRGLSQSGVLIDIYPSPTIYTVTGGGNYCAGGPGKLVGVSYAESTSTYQLYNGTTPVGAPIVGANAQLSFGFQLNGGTYTVVATNIATGCTATMSNSATIVIDAIPNVVITANGPTTFCGSGNVTLTATATGCTFQWYKNGMSVGNLPVYVANAAGSYSVIATNSNGCTNDAYIPVTVNPLPANYTVTSNLPSYCEGGVGVTINQSGSQAGVNYQLMLNGLPSGAPVLGSGILNWSNQAAAGTYTVVATDNTTSCTSTMTGAAVVTENPLPAAAGTITGTATVCQNSVVAYSTSTIPNTMINGYMWSVPTGATIVSGQGTTMIQVNFSGASTGDIGVFGQNGCGTGQASLFPVTVNQAPNIAVTANPTNICVGASSNLTVTGFGSGSSFVWSGGGSNPINNVSPTTSVTYYVTVTGANGCTTNANVDLTVHQLPSVSLALSPNSLCTDGGLTILTGGVGSPAGGTGYYSGACVMGTNSVYPSISAIGTYPIVYTYTDAWGCENSSAAANLTINPLPSVSFGPIYTLGSIVPYSEPAIPLSTGMPAGNTGVYSGPGVTLIGNTYWFTAASAGSGTHMLTYSFTTNAGCTGSQIQYATVGTVGIDEVAIAANAINIFPNPATNNVNLSGINMKEIKALKIINMIGEVVYATDINSENMNINISDYSSGTYIISFINAEGLSQGRMLMKSE